MIKKQNNIYKLSPSALHLLDECPRCFWLTQHKLWKRPIGIFPSLPNGMDRILKEYFDLYRDKHLIPAELKECGEDIKLFDDKQLLSKWQNNFSGITYTDPLGNILMGAVDYILIKNKKLIVLDFKTRGFDLKVNTIEYYRTQLDIYNYLLRKNDYETEDYAYLLFYVTNKITEKGEVLFNKVLKKVEINVDNAEKVWKNALLIINGVCPAEKCEYCKAYEEKIIGE